MQRAIIRRAANHPRRESTHELRSTDVRIAKHHRLGIRPIKLVVNRRQLREWQDMRLPAQAVSAPLVRRRAARELAFGVVMVVERETVLLQIVLA